MATGLEMFDALRRATAGLTKGSVFKINRFDAEDLKQLTASELVTIGFDLCAAERVAHELVDGGLDELGTAIGIKLRVASDIGNLISGEGFRRMARVPIDDGQTVDELLEEVDRIRHPERHPA